MATQPYSITIDDDPLVSRTVEAVTGVRSIPYTSFAAFNAHNIPEPPVAAFVDIHLGLDENGIDLIPTIRTQWAFCPVIVVTTDPSGDAVGQALAAGAHDFIRKPIEPKELTARLRARTVELQERAGQDTVQFGDFSLILSLNELAGPNGVAHLSHSDTRLLQYLARSNGMLITRQELKRRLWGNLKVTDNALDKRLHDVRKALRDVSSKVRLASSYRQGFSLIMPAGTGNAA